MVNTLRDQGQAGFSLSSKKFIPSSLNLPDKLFSPKESTSQINVSSRKVSKFQTFKASKFKTENDILRVDDKPEFEFPPKNLKKTTSGVQSYISEVSSEIQPKNVNQINHIDWNRKTSLEIKANDSLECISMAGINLSCSTIEKLQSQLFVNESSEKSPPYQTNSDS